MPLLENKIIAIENVWLSYTDKNILEDINLDIYQGDFLLITGPNGGGKTSLLRTILRLQSPTKGRISFFRQGEPVSSLDMLPASKKQHRQPISHYRRRSSSFGTYG